MSKQKGESLISFQKPLGKAFKSLRVGERLTQSDVASRIAGKVNQSYISQFERGEIFPSGEVLPLLLDAIGCSPSRLWARAEKYAMCVSDGSNQIVFEDCLSHDQFGHTYEQKAAINETVVKQEKLRQLVVRLNPANMKHKFSRTDVKQFREYVERLSPMLTPLCKDMLATIDGLVEVAFEDTVSTAGGDACVATAGKV